MKVLKIIAFSVAALVVIFFAIGIINPVFEYGNSVTINAPKAKIWSLYANQKEDWIEGFKSQKLISGSSLTNGAEYETTIVSGEKMIMHERIISIRPGERIEWLLENDVLTSGYSFEFVGDSVKTEVFTRYQVEGKNLFMKSLLFSSQGFLKNADADMLAALKNISEK